jgi:hypothetical protein
MNLDTEKETPVCDVCGRSLWYNETLKDGNEEWVCPVRWTGPNLLKRKPNDPEWANHTTTVRPPDQKSIESLVSHPETLRVRDYLQKGLPAIFRRR